MILPDLIKTCADSLTDTYFMFGNWVELCQDLADKGESKTKRSMRYPLVFLHNDYSEEVKGNRVTVDNPKIYLIEESEENYTIQERLDNIYRLVLYPFRDSFLAQMKIGARFIKTASELEYTQKDLYNLYVGDNANRLPDHLDAIELSFRDLKYYLKTC